MRDLSDGQQIWTESAIPLVNYVARRQDGLAGVGVLHGSPDMLTRSSVFAGAIGETANLNSGATHSRSTVQSANRMAWGALLHDQTSAW